MKNRSIEVEAKTTQEAIALGLKKLNVKKEDVEIKILCEERKGLFGMEGAEQAKVKLIVKKKHQTDR
ncbi:MAG: Jag N-terminal domain-containing protein [Candidatus Omnitrophica bacterium]|nr:Jag N-terminal domain-containing protein [Candidatus Omnitrophota bacterium]